MIRKGDFIGVVAENEWDAVRAAQQLKVTWDNAAGAAGKRGAVRADARREDDRITSCSNAATSRRSRERARMWCRSAYRGPYQAHAPFGPNCAIADVKADSRAGEVFDAGRLRDARQAGDACSACRRKRCACSITKVGHLRAQLLRRCGAGRGGAVAGRGQAGAAAVHALG